MPTNDTPKGADYNAGPGEIDRPHSAPGSQEAGYEMTDVNAGNIVVFIGGLFGFVIMFFFVCFFLGRLINNGTTQSYTERYGATDKWHTQNNIFEGAKANNGKREDLKSNFAMQQQELGQMTKAFPHPQLDTDDGNQSTADLHAREDLLLDHYSSVPGEPIRIPIDRAMELIASKGLPVSQAAPATLLAGDKTPTVEAPLTTGFARTGYELDTIEARHQKMEFEGAQHAELKK